MCHLTTLSSLLTLVILLLPSWVHGLPEDRDKPIQLEAERGQLDQKTGTSIYEGNVIITQGTLRLHADTATIYTKDGNFQRIETVGKPATWRYKMAPDKEEVNGSGLHIDYDATKNLLTMSGNAKITQGSDVFTGDYMEYETQTEVVRAKGENGNHIQITIQPKSSILEKTTSPSRQPKAPTTASKPPAPPSPPKTPAADSKSPAPPQ